MKKMGVQQKNDNMGRYIEEDIFKGFNNEIMQQFQHIKIHQGVTVEHREM